MSERRIFTQTLLLLGGNEGDVITNGRWVRSRLEEKYQVTLVSSWYASPSWGFDGPDFLNQVVALELVDSVYDLLEYCLELELELGRVRSKSGGYSSRPMDIDILYHGTEIHRSKKLNVPHPRIQDRRFTLVPLNEHWASFSHPALGKTQRELLLECPDTSEVKLISVDEE